VDALTAFSILIISYNKYKEKPTFLINPVIHLKYIYIIYKLHDDHKI